MANPDIIIPPEIIKTLGERSRIHNAFERARRQAASLSSYSSLASGRPPTNLLAPLTPRGEPPAEIAEAIRQIEQELAQIRQLEALIREYQAKVQKIRRNVLFLKLFFVFAGLLLVLILAHAVHLF